MMQPLDKDALEALQITNMKESTSPIVEPLHLRSDLLDSKIVPILEERFKEAQQCLSHSPLATIMLCGSFLEGLLLGIAQKRPEDFNLSRMPPKDKNGKPKAFKDWPLAQFIDVACDLKLLRLDVKKFSHVLRNFRNYIHPYKQMEENFYPDRHTAELCISVIKLAIHNLNDSNDIPKRITLSDDWSRHPDAAYLALATLMGSWNEANESDREAVARLSGISYHDEWPKKAKGILSCPNSPLSLKNGLWKIANRSELWRQLGSFILNQDLDAFRSLAVSVLKEPDPAFELPVEDRFAANLYGKAPKYSRTLRRGIAEGLAILGTRPDACSNCSQGKAQGISRLVVGGLLRDADGLLWGSLNDLLPILAEAAPGEFLDEVERALRLAPCPFDVLFSQEGNGITGCSYLTGLLLALEGLAWDEQYLVRVCVVLGELARRDPGGQWGNRPSHSLVTILMPWLPQTLASADKCEVAVRTLLKECPDVAWDLLLRLLPDRYQVSEESYKPIWRKTIPDDWEKGVTEQEYRQQVSSYAGLAVDAAGQSPVRLSALIERLDALPEPAFDRLLQVLASRTISELSEGQRLPIWDHLVKFINRHRHFSEEERALSEELIARIECVREQLAPKDPFNLYQHLFTGFDLDPHEEGEEDDDWEAWQNKLDTRREKAISEIFQQGGVEGVIQFAEAVSSPELVGYALGVMTDSLIERTLLPRFLDSENAKHRALANGFVLRSYRLKGWEWCDGIDKFGWTPEQTGRFLTCLPFDKGTWEHASEWLREDEGEYWSRAGANVYQADDGLTLAIDKLMEHGRPFAAISCMGKLKMWFAGRPIDTRQCVQALLAALSSKEPDYTRDAYCVVELIKLLQADSSVDRDELFKVEWAYLPLLKHHGDAMPRLLESRLANDPKFFCDAIQMLYRSKDEASPPKRTTEESTAVTSNIRQLLRNWRMPPGTQEDGAFSGERFLEWLQSVKAICTESGNLEAAFIHLGKVLIHTPPDHDGLWINRTVAGALNDRDAEDMRKGFRMGLYNSRGVHYVDPSGADERKLAGQFRNKAELAENACFPRLAVILRNLADNYEREADWVVTECCKRTGD